MSNSDDKIVSLDIQEINLDAPSDPKRESFSIDTSRDVMPSSSSLGDGIELLMNEKVKNSQGGGAESSTKYMQQELNDLNELNNISIEPDLPSSANEMISRRKTVLSINRRLKLPKEPQRWTRIWSRGTDSRTLIISTLTLQMTNL